MQVFFETNTTRRRGDFFKNRKTVLAACPFYPVTLQKSKCEALANDLWTNAIPLLKTDIFSTFVFYKQYE